jgi:hypothetical protein
MGKASNEVLRRLDSLVGEWEVRAVIGGFSMPPARARFEWLEDGMYLRQYQYLAASPDEVAAASGGMDNPFPTLSITGLDDTTEQFSMLYSDARGVLRIYQMTMADGVWKIWRDAPGFYQRFTGKFSDAGNQITCSWEGSKDGQTWEPDFDLTYVRLPASG